MTKKVSLILLCILVLSCGKKSEPFLPKSRLPFRVILLSAEKKHGVWTIQGEVTGKIGERGYKLSDIKGCKIYYSRFSLKNPPCESCPIYYGKIKKIEGSIVKDGHFFCELPWVKKKGIYYLKVRLIGTRNSIGPPSERVKIEIEE